MPALPKNVEIGLQRLMNYQNYMWLSYRQMRRNLHNTWHGAHLYFHKISDEEEHDENEIAHYILHRFSNPVYTNIPAPTTPDGSVMLPCFEYALQLEEREIQALQEVYELAEEEGDTETCVFLDDIIKDQTMERFNLQQIILYLRRDGGEAAAFFLIDKIIKDFADK